MNIIITHSTPLEFGNVNQINYIKKLVKASKARGLDKDYEDVGYIEIKDNHKCNCDQCNDYHDFEVTAVFDCFQCGSKQTQHLDEHWGENNEKQVLSNYTNHIIYCTKCKREHIIILDNRDGNIFPYSYEIPEIIDPNQLKLSL